MQGNDDENVFCLVHEIVSPAHSANVSRRASAEDFFISSEPAYTIKQLHQIFDYYSLNKHGLNKQKLNKEELLHILYYYEHNAENLQRVQQRHYMWNCLLALKQDPYFSKYIMYNF